MECDAWKVQSYSSDGSFQTYRCHLGICEVLMPLYSRDKPLAWLVFGCFLDDSPIDRQWERTRALLDWWPGDLEPLHRAFLQFRQYSPQELRAYSETLEALSAYIRLEGMIQSAEQSDLQRLELYLDQHYMEKLSLASISRELHIGRTKLCALAKELSGGQTLSHLIAQRRIEAAKRLLFQSGLPISAVAEQVGISDYNYFTKVFRAVTGMTPSAFRKTLRTLEKNHETFRKIVRIFIFVRFFYKANVIPYLFTECPSIIIIDKGVFVNFAYASCSCYRPGRADGRSSY